jgi:hypothetical protein
MYRQYAFNAVSRFMSGGMKGPIGCYAFARILCRGKSLTVDFRAALEWQALRRDDACSQDTTGKGALHV